MRKVEHCPPHFTTVLFDLSAQEKTITDWVWENLEGRFYMGDHYTQREEQMIMQKCVAFELEGEASYFALILDTINKYDSVF